MRTKLVLTGASGWFGRTALYEYEAQYGREALVNEVIPLASKDCQIDIGSPYGPIPAYSLRDIVSISGATGLIHCAFLTRDRLNAINTADYISVNRAITRHVEQFLDLNKSCPAITTSSGAAKCLNGGIHQNPYAYLKRAEEKVWQDNSNHRMSLVFRVYASSGRFIKSPELFALGDFLCKAINKGKIIIKSQRPVFRSYVHIGTMMRLCWFLLGNPLSNGFYSVAATTHTLSLLDLALLISDIWDLPPPLSSVDPNAPPDIYCEDPDKFLRLLNDSSIQPLDLPEMLLETANYIKMNHVCQQSSRDLDETRTP